MIPPSLSRRPRLALGVAVAILVAALSSPAGATDIGITFGSLPSAQGFTYVSSGSPTATEAQAFTAGPGVLTLDTMAFGITGSGTSAYYLQTGVVNNTQPIVVRMRARVIQYEGDFTNVFVGGGLAFGFTPATTAFQMGITSTQIRSINGTILSSAYDNTQFHDYRMEWDPPSTLRYYVDNTLISTNNAGASPAPNRILFGDLTGAANSRSEITEYRFLQGLATPTEGGSWGRLKSLYR